MQQHAVSPVSTSSDEIDLRELACTLWASKWLIALITAIVTLGATAYALLTPPTYQVQVNIAPPGTQDLSNFNMAHELAGPAMSAITSGSTTSGITALTPKTALNAVYAATSSAEFQRQLNMPPNSNQPSVTPPGGKSGNTNIVIQWQGQDPNNISQWARQYAELALSTAKEQLLATLSSTIALQQDSLDLQTLTLREAARVKLDNEIAQLSEALALAENIGLEQPDSTGNLVTPYTGEMAYMRGAEALRADLALRKARTDLDPYIEELPNLLKKQALLRSIQTHPEQLSVGQIEHTFPAQQVKPKKQLIIALGVVLGGMLGIFWVLLRQAFIRPE